MSSSPRLAEAKSSVVNALAEDFDTPRAVSAVMNLVHHANRQLQPVSKVTGAKAHCGRQQDSFLQSGLNSSKGVSGNWNDCVSK